MGVKPLYYARVGSRWLFGSELKALLTQPELDTELDLDAIADFLRLSYIPREATPYLQVRKLLPGHYLFIQGDRFEDRAWWDLAAIPTGPMLAPDSPAGKSQLIAEFDDAVKLRMRSDVPVASFLSGGLDSSVVTITAQRLSSVPMQTFALGFEHTEFDERPYASSVARCAGTNHRELSASVQDAIEQLPLLLWHMDEPIGDSSIIPNYLISRMAAENVKVCLSGLGGDELFGGYSRYFDPGVGKIRKVFQHAPGGRAHARSHGRSLQLSLGRRASARRQPVRRRGAATCTACRFSTRARSNRSVSPPRATPKKPSNRCGTSIQARTMSRAANSSTSTPICRTRFWRSRTACRWRIRSKCACPSWTIASCASRSGFPAG